MQEKHDVILAVLWIFVVVPVLTGGILWYAYSTVAKSVHIPDDVLRAGPGLSAVSAIGGGIAGAGFTSALDFAARRNFGESMSLIAGGIVLTLLGGLIVVTGGVMIMRGGFRTASQQRPDRVSPAVLSQQIRRLQSEPYVTAAESEDYLTYSDKAMRFGNLIKQDSERIRGDWRGFVVFIRMYAFDEGYGKRNSIHRVASRGCALVVTVVVGGAWWLSGASTIDRGIACLVGVEALGWVALRWRYEQIRLHHLAEALLQSAHELRKLCEKKRQPIPGTQIGVCSTRDQRRPVLPAVVTTVLAWIQSRHAADRRTRWEQSVQSKLSHFTDD